MRTLAWLSVLLLAAPGLAAPALAAPFDLIYTDQIDVTLCSNGCGITLAGCDFAVLVNTGTAPIATSVMTAAHFTAVSSEPTIRLTPFLNQYTSEFPDLEPGHARGSVCSNNAFLEALLLPGEVLENIQGNQFLAFNIERTEPENGTFEGPVSFDCTMDMGGERVTFRIDAMLHLGPHAIQFLHGARVHSEPGPPGPIVADLDIRPGDCPNVFNPRSHGVVPMAVVGSSTLDVRAIDVASLRLAGAFSPVRTAFEDAAQASSSSAPCECPPRGTDGVRDLTLKFTSQDVAAALGSVAPGSEAVLTLTGRLADGTSFEASDCMQVSAVRDSGITRMEVRQAPFLSAAQITYALAADADVALGVYDVTGRRLESLIEGRQPGGEHMIQWQAGSRPRGIYFFRLAAAGRVETRRFILLK